MAYVEVASMKVDQVWGIELFQESDFFDNVLPIVLGFEPRFELLDGNDLAFSFINGLGSVQRSIARENKGRGGCSQKTEDHEGSPGTCSAMKSHEQPRTGHQTVTNKKRKRKLQGFNTLTMSAVAPCPIGSRMS